MRTICVLVLLTPAGTFAADPKPDFTVTAQDFGKQYQTDANAFRKKYAGTVVELTGTVWTTNPAKRHVLLHGNKMKDTFFGEYIPCHMPEKLQEQLRGLAKGQQVTFRGKYPKTAAFPGLEECEIVKLGPSTAIPVTVESLVAEFKKDPDAARKKYDEKSVVVRVKVLDAKTDDDKVRWSVADVAGKGGTKIEAWADSYLEKKFLTELEKVKAGDVLVLIAEASPLGDPVRLWDAVVVKEPPTGVKLPGGKK